MTSQCNYDYAPNLDLTAIVYPEGYVIACMLCLKVNGPTSIASWAIDSESIWARGIIKL